jgi:VanZ family protein
LDKRFFSYLNLLIAWSFLILLLTLIPFGELDRIKPFEFNLMDKTAHICLFGIHSFLLAGFLKKNRVVARLNRRVITTAISLSFLFGLFIECLQFFIPERSFEIFDIIANFIGILMGVVVFYIKLNFFAN